jgi:hypothetical protein
VDARAEDARERMRSEEYESWGGSTENGAAVYLLFYFGAISKMKLLIVLSVIVHSTSLSFPRGRGSSGSL